MKTDVVTLAYALRLYPTANKASVLPLYIREFQRLHAAALETLLDRAWTEGHAEIPLGGFSKRGLGKFHGRAVAYFENILRELVKED